MGHFWDEHFRCCRMVEDNWTRVLFTAHASFAGAVWMLAPIICFFRTVTVRGTRCWRGKYCIVGVGRAFPRRVECGCVGWVVWPGGRPCWEDFLTMGWSSKGLLGKHIHLVTGSNCSVSAKPPWSKACLGLASSLWSKACLGHTALNVSACKEGPWKTWYWNICVFLNL